MNTNTVIQPAEIQPEPDSTVPIPSQQRFQQRFQQRSQQLHPLAGWALGVSTLSTGEQVYERTVANSIHIPATETSRGLRTGHRGHHGASGTEQQPSPGAGRCATISCTVML